MDGRRGERYRMTGVLEKKVSWGTGRGTVKYDDTCGGIVLLGGI